MRARTTRARQRWTARALVAIGWYALAVITTVTYVFAAYSEVRPTRTASPFDFAHFSFLAIATFAIERLVARFPLAPPHLVPKLVLHALFASAISTLAGLATAVVMGVFDRLSGYQHVLNTLQWYLTPHVWRLRSFFMEQTFYFATATMFEMLRRGEMRRDAERRGAAVEADLARAELAAAQQQMPPAYLRDVFRSLRDLVAVDADRAESLIGSLARFLREAIEVSGKHELTAGDDVRMVDSFVRLEAERHGRPIAFVSDLTADEKGVLIPALAILRDVLSHGDLSRVSAVRVSNSTDGVRAVIETG
jgi:hypothetical protein